MGIHNYESASLHAEEIGSDEDYSTNPANIDFDKWTTEIERCRLEAPRILGLGAYTLAETNKAPHLTDLSDLYDQDEEYFGLGIN